MKKNEMEQKIIENYQKDEGVMILIFAQWCVNNYLDPFEIYRKAYPNQGDNPLLKQMAELTVPKSDSEEIPTETLLAVLSMFENDELAYVIHSHMQSL